MNTTSNTMRVFGIACATLFIAVASVITAHAITNSLNQPVLHIDFHEGSGNLASDLTSNGNDGVLKNGTGWTTGKFGGGISLNGIDNYVRVESTDKLQDSTNGFTVCTWGNLSAFNTSASSDQSLLIGKGMSDFGKQAQQPYTIWELFLRNDPLNDATYPMFSISDGSIQDSTDLGSKIPLNTWMQYCGVFDPAAQTMSLYLNGQLNVTKHTDIAAFGHNDQPVLIGTYGSSDYPNFWNGSIDDVRIYNYALSASDIQKLYAPGAPTITLNGDAHASTTVGVNFVDPGASATDDLDGTLTVVTTSDPSPIDFNATGTFTLTYSATNSSALAATVSRILDIIPAAVSTTTSTTTTSAVGNGDDDGVIIPPNTTTSTTTATTTTTVANGDDDGVIIPPTTQNTSSTTATTTTTTVANGDDDAPSTPPANPVVEQARWISVSSGGTSGGGSILPPSNPIASNAGTNQGRNTAGTVPAQGQVLGAESACSKYLFNPLKYGDDRDDVAKLQAFLNEILGVNLPLNGVFGPATKAAVDQFQLKYKTDILVPWMHEGFNLSGKPTGYVGPTTLRMINNLVCPDLQLPIPELH